MLSSTLFHTFSCHSEDVHKYWRYTDHFGILAALFGTYVSLISNTFICFPVSTFRGVISLCDRISSVLAWQHGRRPHALDFRGIIRSMPLNRCLDQIKSLDNFFSALEICPFVSCDCPVYLGHLIQMHRHKEKVSELRDSPGHFYLCCHLFGCSHRSLGLASRRYNATSRFGQASANYHTLYRWCYWPFLLCHSFS